MLMAITLKRFVIHRKTDVTMLYDRQFVDELTSIPNLRIVKTPHLSDVDIREEMMYFYFKFVTLDCYHYKQLPSIVKTNKEIASSYILKYPRGFLDLPLCLRDDKEFVVSVITTAQTLRDRRFIHFYLSSCLYEDVDICEVVEFGNRIVRMNTSMKLNKISNLNFKFK
jgi:hypothetical protein